MNRLTAPLVAAALAALSLTPVLADSHTGAHAETEVLTGWRAENGTHMAALRITLAPGWKTYWRAPGEAGLPPQFDWSGSANLAEVKLHWPVPETFTSNGMTTFGYHDELVLPMEIIPIDAGADVALNGTLAMGICHEICMPMQTEVTALLSGAATAADARITEALDHQPESTTEAGVASVRCKVEPISDGLRVSAKIDMPRLGPTEMTVFEAATPDIWVSEAITRRAQNMLTATADLVPPTAQPFELDTRSLRLTVLAGDRAVDIQGCTLTR